MEYCLNQGCSGIKGLEISNLKFATLLKWPSLPETKHVIAQNQTKLLNHLSLFFIDMAQLSG